MRDFCRLTLSLTSALLLGIVTVTQAVAQDPTAAREDATFNQARAQTEPKARIAALEAYLQEYPTGSRHIVAQELLLDTVLSAAVGESEQIHRLTTEAVQTTSAGIERWIEEARLARQLADAGVGRLNLEDAEVWARDAVSSLTEASYRREATAAQLRYKLPRPAPAQLHTEYTQYRASFLTAMAAVDLRLDKQAEAAGLLTQAFQLQPLSGEVNALRGQLALARGDDAGALQSLERADALGALHQPWRDRELQLFQTLEHGDAAALASHVDEVYRGLFPAPFTLPRRQLPAGGHTALLELFTGSGCFPCAGPDLAVESLLHSYSRQDLAILEFDEHIPRPDPLANPDAVARAAVYGVGSTPSAFLDGVPLDVLGAARSDVENIVVSFAAALEDVAMLPSGLHLALEVHRNGDTAITVRPAVTLAPRSGAQVGETTGEISFRSLSKAVLQVALVQDHIRYSGENGVRLHRMVVRSLAQAETTAYLRGGTTAPPVLFDLAALEQKQQAYLLNYEQSNDRFGAFQFLTTDIPFRGGSFAVVAWVQDPATHKILQAAFADVPGT